jgi:Outer membrane lipoprotein-sorting protein
VNRNQDQERIACGPGLGLNEPSGIYDALMLFLRIRDLLLAVVFISIAAGAWPEDVGATSVPGISAVQIAEQMQVLDQACTQRLKHYKALRHYHVEYHGFSAAVVADMTVEVTFDAASGKSFRIVSESGSKFLAEKVLRRAVDSEKEAAQSKSSSTMNPGNYKFKLVGSETVGGNPAYILEVEPRVASKFMVRGRVWVDQADFAVVKMETQPAKSPSFWISRTLIEYTGSKTDGFWFPQKVRSETKVRIGGTAVLTIDYGSYQIASK